MELLRIALKDLTRRQGRSAYLFIAVLIPVAILSTIMLTLDNADSTLSNLASKFGFTLSIQPKNVKQERIDQVGVVLGETLDGKLVEAIQQTILARVEGEEQKLVISPRLYETTDIVKDGRTSPALVAGLNLDAERTARPSWSLSVGRWADPGRNEAVAGGTFARVNGLSPDDLVSVAGRSIRIAGVLENYNSSEDHMLFVDLETAQELFSLGGRVSLVNVQSVGLDRNPDLMKSVIGMLNTSIPNIKAISPQQFTTLKFVLLKKTFRFLLAIVLATIIVSVFSIFNIVTTALYSRVREIGLLKSVGASRRQLLLIFIYEYLLVGFVAGTFGFFVGMGCTWILDRFLLKLGSSVILNPAYLLGAVTIGMVCSLSASYYPTYRLSGIKITESFRSQWEV